MLMRRREAGQGGGCVCGLNQLAAMVPCANVDSGCIAMAHRHAVVQAFQFDPESDPDGEAPDEEVATAGRLRMVSLKYCVWIRYFSWFVYVCCYSYYHVANASLHCWLFMLL